MVIECMFAGWVNKAARLRIRSTSSFGPEKPRLAVWFDISLEQASKGIICVSFFLVSRVESANSTNERLERAAYLHIQTTTRAADLGV